MGSLGPNNKPLSPCPPELDPKWRFFWRIGPVPPKTNFPSLNADAVIPPEIPEWGEVMDMWGNKMQQAVFVLAEMAAEGFSMPADAFTSRMMYGPHLLAPTGSDFNKFGKKDTVLAGYHYDLNFLTIHGKSRFPGLNVWTREGRRMGVAIPDGCLLVQAGRQIEYLTGALPPPSIASILLSLPCLTPLSLSSPLPSLAPPLALPLLYRFLFSPPPSGGHVLAGYHEVIVNDQTMSAISAKKAKKQSLWRVSSTLFAHIQSDQVLEPLAPFSTKESVQRFPPKKAGQQVTEELQAINLDQSK